MAGRVRDLREAVQLPGRAGAAGDATRAGGRRPVHGLDGRADVHLRAEADVPLPHRRAGDGAELRGRVQPRRQPEARFTGDDLHARDRRRRRGDRRQGAIDLRRPRARPLPAPDPADQAGRRLHRPADDAVLLPDPAGHADRPGRDQQPARVGPVLRRRADRQPADRARSETRTTAATGRRTSTRSSGRSAPPRPACSPSSRTGSTTASSAASSAGRCSGRWPRSTASTDPAGSSSSAPSLTTWFIAFNHDRPAFKGPGQIPLKKAINYAIDRPELARTLGYLAGKRTDQMLPPALARAESIYPLEGAEPATARKWLARAKHQADDSSSSTRTTARPVSPSPRRSSSTSSRSASSSRSSTSTSTTLAEKVGDPR